MFLESFVDKVHIHAASTNSGTFLSSKSLRKLTTHCYVHLHHVKSFIILRSRKLAEKDRYQSLKPSDVRIQFSYPPLALALAPGSLFISCYTPLKCHEQPRDRSLSGSQSENSSTEFSQQCTSSRNRILSFSPFYNSSINDY